jgi:Ca2+-binding RTX toxin-like protein
MEGTMSRKFIGPAGILALAFVLMTAAPAIAAPASLTGETLNGDAATMDDCSDPSDTATFSFDSSGDATGPYEGTYTESGTFTVDEANEVPTQWDSTFTITADDGTVITGEKHGIVDANDAFCGAGSGGFVFLTTSYTATIEFTDRSFCDDMGTSEVNLDSTESSAPGGFFNETYDSTSLSCGVHPDCNGQTPPEITIANNPPFGTHAYGTAGVTATYDSGTGVVTITGTDGPDVIIGTNGPDAIDGNDGADSICARDGEDFVRGLGGADWLASGADDDRVYGGAADDMIFGRGGHDKLYGAGGTDTIRGGSGNDLLQGDGGDDFLYGEDNRDTLDGDNGAPGPNPPGANDFCDGGANADTQVDSRCETVVAIP